MTRTQKITKLANAIREYRGCTVNGEWVIPPHKAAIVTVIRWLTRLKLDIKENVDRIDGFKSLNEFWAWLRGLQ